MLAAFFIWYNSASSEFHKLRCLFTSWTSSLRSCCFFYRRRIYLPINSVIFSCRISASQPLFRNQLDLFYRRYLRTHNCNFCNQLCSPCRCSIYSCMCYCRTAYYVSLFLITSDGSELM